MASGPKRARLPALVQWIGPLHSYWKPLAWFWAVVSVGICINVLSSRVTINTFDVSGTPLGWALDHLPLMLPLLFLLVLLTLLCGRSWWLQRLRLSSLKLSLAQRLRLLRGLEQEYSSQLASRLQGLGRLELQLQERSGVTTSWASVGLAHLERGQASALPETPSLLQAYDQAQHGLLLLGTPGSGKTTLLLELALQLLRRAEHDPLLPLPIMLDLSSWAATRPLLPNWLPEQCSLVYGIPRQVAFNWITGPLWIAPPRGPFPHDDPDQVQFLLDGLDEVGEEALPFCIEAINGYSQTYRPPLVVSSRKQEYLSQSARLLLSTAVEISPLEPAQILGVLGRQANRCGQCCWHCAPIRCCASC